jgi:DNA-binding CsgD family transcriptional regulator|tara:strand:+ start:321 stop:725 length:405 start_codon:yes stop_codon:yes gene_type:complete
MGVKKLYDYGELKPAEHKYKIKDREIPINLIEDFLHFYNLGLEDLAELTKFSKNLKQEKEFKKRNDTKFDSLTKKEKEILNLVVKGYSSKEIASLLFIEVTTVGSHRKNIKQKLDLKSIFDWYKYARSFNRIDF